LRPDLAQLHANLSNALRDSWQLDEALAAAKASLNLNPDLPEAHASLGAAMLMLGRFDEAISACRAAIQLKPDLPAAHLNHALAELVTGNLERAWPNYLWWMRCPQVRPRLPGPVSLWDGTRIDGKTILLYSDQGFGDAIQFIRYAPMVAAMGARVVVECPPALLSLFKRCAGADVVLATGSPLPHCDYQCPLASLPALFKTTLPTIPAPIPYLTADSNIIEAWRKRIASTKDTIQIGLAWAGRPENRNDRNRSIAGNKFSPLANMSGVRFHSLQKSREVIPSLALSNWSELLTDFAETAGLIANLDFIISVDTAVAHLAGAMGKPVWLLVPFPPEWRWMLDRADSPWYPTMRLFRQKTPGDWESVIQTVAGELAALAGSGLGNSIR
jgi:tetratricopeptide (TPR) repeat protein